MIRLGRRWLAVVVGLFVVLPIIDIWLLVIIGHRIGALPVVLLLIAEAALGGWLIRRRWRSFWRTLSDSTSGPIDVLRPGESIGQAIDTMLVVVGGVALIVPGLITDLVGVICLVPYTRRFPAALLRRAVERRMPGLGDLATPGPQRSGYGDVIEGEVVAEGPANGSGRGPHDPDEPVVIRGEVSER
ncbi:FxsA family protein [Microlunatus sp. Gsoil 973]|uniref:FxsA family protein n=1 Tax=Microlunatus sp. Gsoil 973 TaxID=2672569 RepID=UPI0018A833EA|nr:FxsA family protein [Microlunatus sp. Gsoil 973]